MPVRHGGGPPGKPPRGRFTIVYLIHEAFRRDLSRLREAVGSLGADQSRARRLRVHWEFVNDQLHEHHRVEDESLWPLVRSKLAGDSDDLGVLKKMEAQHQDLEPQCEGVTQAFAALCVQPGAREGQSLVEGLGALSSVLSAHLGDEESQAFPVIDRSLSEEEFESFGKATAKAVGMRGAARFFPWIFDGAEAVERDAVLRMPPPPVRLLCGYVWEPRYRRQAASLWVD
jgi:hemerythrin-like domain-containing protein